MSNQEQSNVLCDEMRDPLAVVLTFLDSPGHQSFRSTCHFFFLCFNQTLYLELEVRSLFAAWMNVENNGGASSAEDGGEGIRIFPVPVVPAQKIVPAWRVGQDGKTNLSRYPKHTEHTRYLTFCGAQELASTYGVKDFTVGNAGDSSGMFPKDASKYERLAVAFSDTPDARARRCSALVAPFVRPGMRHFTFSGFPHVTFFATIKLCNMPELKTLDCPSHCQSVQEVTLENLPSLEVLESRFLAECGQLKKWTHDGLPRLKTIAGYWMFRTGMVTVKLEKLPMLQKIGALCLCDCRDLISVTLSSLPSLISVDRDFCSDCPSLRIRMSWWNSAGHPEACCFPNESLQGILVKQGGCHKHNCVDSLQIDY